MAGRLETGRSAATPGFERIACVGHRCGSGGAPPAVHVSDVLAAPLESDTVSFTVGKPLPTAYYGIRQAEDRAKILHQSGGGWHAFRRAWATARKHMPLQDLWWPAAGGTRRRSSALTSTRTGGRYGQ